jgi:hypothetical protein
VEGHGARTPDDLIVTGGTDVKSGPCWVRCQSVGLRTGKVAHRPGHAEGRRTRGLLGRAERLRMPTASVRLPAGAVVTRVELEACDSSMTLQVQIEMFSGTPRPPSQPGRHRQRDDDRREDSLGGGPAARVETSSRRTGHRGAGGPGAARGRLDGLRSGLRRHPVLVGYHPCPLTPPRLPP